MSEIMRYLSKQPNTLNPLQKGQLLRDKEREQRRELLGPAVTHPAVRHRVRTGAEHRWRRLLFRKQLESGDPLFGGGFGRYL